MFVFLLSHQSVHRQPVLWLVCESHNHKMSEQCRSFVRDGQKRESSKCCDPEKNILISADDSHAVCPEESTTRQGIRSMLLHSSTVVYTYSRTSMIGSEQVSAWSTERSSDDSQDDDLRGLRKRARGGRHEFRHR